MDLPDSEVLAAMSHDEFDTFWQALGVTVRVAAVVKHRPDDAKREISNTSVSAERKWSPATEAPASARAVGFRAQLSPARAGDGGAGLALAPVDRVGAQPRGDEGDKNWHADEI